MLPLRGLLQAGRLRPDHAGAAERPRANGRRVLRRRGRPGADHPADHPAPGRRLAPHDDLDLHHVEPVRLQPPGDVRDLGRRAEAVVLLAGGRRVRGGPGDGDGDHDDAARQRRLLRLPGPPQLPGGGLLGGEDGVVLQVQEAWLPQRRGGRRREARPGPGLPHALQRRRRRAAAAAAHRGARGHAHAGHALGGGGCCVRRMRYAC
mmetsp:Transcript_63936/g.164572  ORF Transcript_63936/g.164572 Transcript_63936/m.164572 type:complete len:206 (-) Transcript_63936:393-1010(-)